MNVHLGTCLITHTTNTNLFYTEVKMSNNKVLQKINLSNFSSQLSMLGSRCLKLDFTLEMKPDYETEKTAGNVYQLELMLCLCFCTLRVV